jgi:hypothetical protein
MTEEQKRQYQEVRERIAKIIGQYTFNISWNDCTGYQKANTRILVDAILSDYDILVKAKDQTLPENLYKNGWNNCFTAFDEGQKSMADAHFVRILPREVDSGK